MLEFNLFQFDRYSHTLLRLQHEIEEDENKGESLTPQEQRTCAVLMHQIKSFVTRFEINTGRCFERIELKIHQPEQVTTKLSELIRELRNRINDELKERLFMFVPTKDAEYYNHMALFGLEVANKFPKANEEITEAGNCYATGNYTACVFHLMRVVEYGARSLVRALKIKRGTGPDDLPHPVELCDWGTIYGRLDRAVRRMPVRTSVRVSETQAFYSHAVAQFGHFRTAWRNKISHSRANYNDRPHLVTDIMDNTRHFMQHLAERLKETG